MLSTETSWAQNEEAYLDLFKDLDPKSAHETLLIGFEDEDAYTPYTSCFSSLGVPLGTAIIDFADVFDTDQRKLSYLSYLASPQPGGFLYLQSVKSEQETFLIPKEGEDELPYHGIADAHILLADKDLSTLITRIQCFQATSIFSNTSTDYYNYYLRQIDFGKYSRLLLRHPRFSHSDKPSWYKSGSDYDMIDDTGGHVSYNYIITYKRLAFIIPGYINLITSEQVFSSSGPESRVFSTTLSNPYQGIKISTFLSNTHWGNGIRSTG